MVFVLPTGGGKTVVFSHIAQQAEARQQRIAVLVHRTELLDQASRSLNQLGVSHGLIAAGRSMNLAAAVQVASVQALARRLDQLPPELFQLLIIDEAHHSNAGSWTAVLQHFQWARRLGVTATPVRGDGRGLGELYSALIEGPTTAWLSEQGYLAEARVYAPPIGFTHDGLRRRLGDYDLQQAASRLGGRQILGDAVSHYQRHLNNQTAIAFCCSLQHAEAVATAFRQRGISASVIDGRLKPDERRRRLEQLASGDLKVLTSCSLIGEGVDVPSVMGCILLRPTQSLALHLQMIGRCLRPQPGKQAVVLDHVGNIERLGHHLDPQEWTLEGRRQRRQAKAPAVRVCPACFAAVRGGQNPCPECGHNAPQAVTSLEQLSGDLQELEHHQLQKHRRAQQAAARTLEELTALGTQRGMRNPQGWARHVLAARHSRNRQDAA